VRSTYEEGTDATKHKFAQHFLTLPVNSQHSEPRQT
jgi:hypothetical protein